MARSEPVFAGQRDQAANTRRNNFNPSIAHQLFMQFRNHFPVCDFGACQIRAKLPRSSADDRNTDHRAIG